MNLMPTARLNPPDDPLQPGIRGPYCPADLPLCKGKLILEILRGTYRRRR